ncbi:hypothetical protein ACP70R_041309 [Stipagrostis hirtigluma subsp. patula]
MEGTALSLAKLTLETVLPVAKQAMANDALLLLGVRQEASFIANELEMMQAFLRAADTSDRARNEVVRVWVHQVRDLAYDVEDCLHEYLALDLAAGGASRWRCRWLRVAAAAGEWLSLSDRRRRIAARIREVKAGVEEVSKRNLRYSIVVQPGPAVDPAACREMMSISPTLAADVAAEERSLVGRGAQRAELVGHLVASPRDAPLQVLAVWGMGGMGKTVLVRDVLRSPEVAEAFDRRAWVTVPRPFSTAEFLDGLLAQLDAEAAGGAASAASRRRVRTRAEYPVAMHRVARHLEDRRFVVVVDDVASVATEWESIRRVLPDRSTGSWVIVTTRREDVARHCGAAMPSQPYKLDHLSAADALQLLLMKAHVKPHPPPQELMDEATQILQRCCGLPLAVAAIGGLLATKPKTAMEWKKLHDHLGSELRANPGLEETKNVLTSSYDALPYHLKSCFLYLSVFPRHREMLQTRMVWRWMAEGLIVRSRDMAPEDAGELCFNQLISRSMIQPVTNWVNLNNRIKTCQVHDLMREIILANSIEENHLFVLHDQHHSPSSSWTLPSNKVRHLVVITTTTSAGDREHQDDDDDDDTISALESINVSHVRSITVVGDRVPPLSVLSKMRMLRVLDLEDCPSAKDADLRCVGELRHLKYLGLRRTSVSKLPASVGRLKFLQTLDLRGTKVTVLPRGVTKLQKLRHLLAGSDMSNYGHTATAAPRPGANTSTSSSLAALDPWNGVRLPEGVDKLRNLHELGRVNVGHGAAARRTLNDIGKMAGLHYLGVTDLTERDGPELCDTIHKLQGLGDLEVRSRAHGSLHFLERISSPPPHLLILRLFGRLGALPAWVASLREVTKVKLLATEVAQDAIEVLGGLPSLVALHLWRRSFVGRELRLGAGRFGRLKLLALDSLDGLASLAVEAKAMPQLEWLWVYRCVALRDGEGGVTGVMFLPKLREIRLKCGDGKSQLEAALHRQVREHHNRPQLIV